LGEEKMDKILKKFLDIALEKKAGHLGPCLSALPIMAALYNRFEFDGDNFFVLSKGHAALGYYTILNHFGYITDDDLNNVYSENSKFYGHISRNPEKGIAVTAGSLGHAASIAVGLAMAQPDKEVYCLLGDGECDEGSVWEAFSFAFRNKVKNINFIIDYNGYQGYDKLIEKTLPKKIDSFGMDVKHCLSLSAFEKYLDRGKGYVVRPHCYICYTDKTGGFKNLNGMSSHYRKMNEELYYDMLGELE
jgi:transketolase